MAILIHCSPQIVMLTLDRQKYLIKVPRIPGPRTAATERIGIVLAKLATPFADRLLGHDHTTFAQ
jgi:hypothetical protein